MTNESGMSDVYSRLFERILAGSYKPGTRLKEENLAKEFGISRTPVREALNLLDQDCLIQKEHRRGARVIGFTFDDVEEIYEIRKALEVQALRYAIPNMSIQTLKEFRSEILAQQQTHDQVSFEEFDIVLHQYFIDQSKRLRLIRMLDQVNRIVRGLRHRTWGGTEKIPFSKKIIAKALEAHLQLVDAIILRDVDHAVQLMSDHIEQSKRDALLVV